MVQLEEDQGKSSGLEQLPYNHAVSRGMLRFQYYHPQGQLKASRKVQMHQSFPW